MLIKSLTFIVCLPSLVHWWWWLEGRGGLQGGGGFMNRAAAVIELFVLSILNLKLL